MLTAAERRIKGGQSTIIAAFLPLPGLSRPACGQRAQAPADMDSMSLRPFLCGASKLSRSIVRSALEGWTLVFDGRYKLISGNLRGKVCKADQAKDLVLYDLKNDPGETTDVVARHPDVVERLKPMLSPVEARAGQRA